MLGLITSAVDEVYKLASDDDGNSQPKRYAARIVPEVDEAIARTGSTCAISRPGGT